MTATLQMLLDSVYRDLLAKQEPIEPEFLPALYERRSELYGLIMVENPTVPPNEIQFRDKDQRILGRIVNVDKPE